MSNRWLDLSELIAGLCLSEEIEPQIINSNYLYPPFNQLVQGLQLGEEHTDIANKVGWGTFSTAKLAAKAYPGGIPVDFASALETMYSRAQAGKLLVAQGKKLEEGEEPDVGEIQRAIRDMDSSSTLWKTLDEIDPAAVIWTPTYYEPVDLYTGGVPLGGLSIIAGPPGTGKTSFFLKMALQSAKRRIPVGLVSLEMTHAQIAKRTLELDASVSDRTKSYVHLTEAMMDADQIYATVSARVAQYDLKMVGIDFADLAVKRGESGTQQIEHVYLTCKALGKNLGIPVILLAQLNQNYTGGVPRVNHLRWSRLAEALSDLILLIYNPNQIWADGVPSKQLRAVPDHGYLIFGKSKFGVPGVDDGDSQVGAVLVEWDGLTGWGLKAKGWTNLAGS